MRKILCLDFDGVLHSYESGWKVPDEPTDGAMEFMVGAMERFEVAIFSSRSRYFGGRWAMKRWLRRHLVEHWWSRSPGRSARSGYSMTAMDMQEEAVRWARSIVRQLSFPTQKPPAHLTIDDRAITFHGQWLPLSIIESFRPWNKRGEN